jgi:hypothetical protein
VTIIGDGKTDDIPSSKSIEMNNMHISEDDQKVELTAGEYKSITVEFRSTDNLRKSNFESEGLLETVRVQFMSSGGDKSTDF